MYQFNCVCEREFIFFVSDSIAYDKMYAALTNKQLVNGIKQEKNGKMEKKLYLNRVALSARRLVSIGALYLDINYL